MEKVYDIRERTLQYSLRAVKLCQALKENSDSTGSVIGKQYLRSATSIGANLQEGHSGESNADFVHKYGIAQKEARESLYWLRILEGANIFSSAKLHPIIEETNEIISIITSIIVKVKNKNKDGEQAVGEDCRGATDKIDESEE